MQVNVKPLLQEAVVMDVLPATEVATFRATVAAHFAVPFASVQLSFAGQTLQDHDDFGQAQSLESYAVVDGSELDYEQVELVDDLAVVGVGLFAPGPALGSDHDDSDHEPDHDPDAPFQLG